MSDNNTAASYINYLEGCRSLECNSIAKDIWDWAIDKHIWLSAAHIPGSSNIDADQLSRNLNLDLEWKLSAPIFQRIVALFGKPDIDLFASRLNAQVEHYVSWKPHPMANFVDAFTINWSQFFFYAYPPFCLVSRSESGSSNPGRSSSPTPTTAVDGMQVIRRSLQESEISPDTVDIIMHSWRDSTQKQYKVLFKSGLSYSALNTARSVVLI
ncbi:unnamed protein product [Porites evermanni]|uniref:Uncharacterized protein n=1 Tax=Porites evermanni TaxID=104178 RepID=A0ABN8QQF4_9CNID|nr:unnamed protein product [Porites evermanni]